MTLEDSIKRDPANCTASEQGCSEINPTSQKPTTSTDSDPDFTCPVCSSPSISSCRNCKKISYCGKAHQRIHWKEHKTECFPLIHQHDPILGSRLIATRNIKPGEIIWRENPLLSGLGKAEKGEEKATKSSITNPTAAVQLCLGCFQVVNSDYRCPSCSWAMCGPQCIGVGDHHELECKIFTSSSRSHEQLFVDLAHLGKGESREWYKYWAITILRGILLKELDPTKWKKILKLDEMRNRNECDNFQEIPSTTDFGQFCHEFIISLNLLNVTNEDIALVLRVISHRHCEVYEDELCNLRDGHFFTKPRAFHLYYTACQATPNCVPNSSWIIQENTTKIHLRALLPIQFGRTVTLSYANAEEDVMGRQAWLGLGHGESRSATTVAVCECERCKDPEELCTFFSAIKCPGGDHHESSTESPTSTTNFWLLPTVQIQVQEKAGNKLKQLMWQCHECGLAKDSNYYNQVISNIKKDFCDICCVLKKTEENQVWRSTLIENLESLSQKHSDNSVHPNHFIIYKVEILLLQHMSSELADANGKLTDEKWTLLVEKFTRMCKKWLEVADVLWPGLSRQRGQLLYYYQQALILQLILSISKRMRGRGGEGVEGETAEEEPEEELKDFSNIQQSLLEKQFLKILNIRKVVVDIFCYDESQTIGRKFANDLVQKCPEIEILKRYVFQTSKNIT